jgi:ADP-ribose pyrophosphatase
VFANQYAEIHNDLVRFPGGSEGTYIRVTCGTSKSIAVLPITTEGKMVAVKLYRHGVRGWGSEIPKGAIEENETAEEAAARELAEETGYTYGKLIPVGEYSESPAIFGGKLVCFIALDCKFSDKTNREEAEAIDKAFEISTRDFLEQKYEADFTDAVSELLVYKYLSIKETCRHE